MFIFSARLAALAVRPISRPLEQRLRRAIFRCACMGIMRLSGARIEVRGTPPRAPFFLVANHLAIFDIFLLASQLGCVFVSRGDLAGWPVFGFIARHMNTIFIDRERLKDTVRVNEMITAVMNEGDGVAVFPEGGISVTGEVQPFKPALLEPPVRMALPVHYAAIHYVTPEGCPPASEVIVWKDDDMTFIDHFMSVAALPYYRAIVTFAESPISGTDRKALAEDLCEAVRAQFTPLA